MSMPSSDDQQDLSWPLVRLPYEGPMSSLSVGRFHFNLRFHTIGLSGTIGIRSVCHWTISIIVPVYQVICMIDIVTIVTGLVIMVQMACHGARQVLWIPDI